MNVSKSMMFVVVGVALLFAASDCTIHPPGERQERQIAAEQGTAYAKRPEERVLPALSANPTSEELVRYALLASPDLEQRYWEWRSAIEQVPQDGTQPTNLVLFAGVPITRGSTAFNRTTVTVANDPMADIQWPSKPATAARRALENARAAGLRFQRAKYDLRQKVLDAYYDYALAAELLRLERANAELLGTAATVAEAGIASGRSSQSAALRARTEADLSRNQIAEMESRLPGLRASLNASLGRDPAAALAPPSTVPPDREVHYGDEAILHLAAERNPELAALDAEVRASKQGLRLAKLQYVPDFSLSASTDLAATAQNLMAMVTVPYLRYEAINAAIHQAEANIRATDAMRRQTDFDLRSRIISDITGLRDAERQAGFLDHVVLPRARQSVEVTRSSYEGGRATIADVLDAQRSVLALERLVANLKVTHERRLVDVESVSAVQLDVYMKRHSTSQPVQSRNGVDLPVAHTYIRISE